LVCKSIELFGASGSISQGFQSGTVSSSCFWLIWTCWLHLTQEEVHSRIVRFGTEVGSTNYLPWVWYLSPPDCSWCWSIHFC